MWLIEGAKAGNSVPKPLRKYINPYMEEKERDLANISSRVVWIWIDVPVSKHLLPSFCCPIGENSFSLDRV